ncbi:MAG: hypothetical protein NQU42_02040 [Methanothrix sp.]|uniref:hypothetical protein n=1 Tax=Methanothrix sp. TaxID=90426 RepID=UPI0025F1E29D|nr:hypothetical protein [Methanothrix sp.]MCQ8902868.1 hypothetical protein [Methanothrix sp.]
MYSDVLTMCWSIKEVNKNLSDREPLMDYTVRYLKNACSRLGEMLIQIDAQSPGEEIGVRDRDGRERRFSLKEIAKMLLDAKKVVEFNLIDNIESWARSKA